MDASDEPSRSEKDLLVHKEFPYNAEPELGQLIQHFITPERLFFCRTHGPVPSLDESTHRICFEGLGITDAPVSFSVMDLKEKFKKTSITMAMQCAGNRRNGLNDVKPTAGIVWGPGAVGNAVYAGCRLKDVLESLGVSPTLGHNPKLHVAFEAAQPVEKDAHYGASVPLSKALDEFGDVLLVYEMNGKPLSRDHGYPLRVVIPGYIGARSVKYLSTVRIQDRESTSYYQKRDYKILPENVATKEEAEPYWSKTPALGEYNVQSYVCDPPEGRHTRPSGQKHEVYGYALSGGGRGIQRVDVSGDNGKTWVQAELHTQPESERNSAYTWSWCIWKANVEVQENIRIMSRAMDTAGNIQQELPVWNLRGVMNNAWRTDVGNER
ncbi:sulfite oxidase [Dichotomocladium elegans]|nr:sulfite oxidase [Dichotomocladium elegans]